jgi:hypothetical protein
LIRLLEKRRILRSPRPLPTAQRRTNRGDKDMTTHPSRLIVAASSALLLAACGSSDDDAPAAQSITAQQACAALAGKTIAGATLTAAAVPASGAVPTYCKVNGTLAPSLNFEMRLPDVWNGKLY